MRGLRQGKGPQRGWGCCAGASEALGPLGGAAKSPAAGSSSAVCQALSLHRHLSGVTGGALNNRQLLEQRGWGCFIWGCFIWDCTCAACCTSFEAGRCWKHTGKLLRGAGWGQPCEAAPGTMSCRCLPASPPGCDCAAGARSSSVEMSLSLYGWSHPVKREAHKVPPGQVGLAADEGQQLRLSFLAAEGARAFTAGRGTRPHRCRVGSPSGSAQR